MPSTTGVAPLGRTVVLPKSGLGVLIERLWGQGYTVIGPTISQQAIVLDVLKTVDQLPIGWTDEQEGGRYRLKRRSDQAYFGYNVGPHSWKQFLFPPEITLLQIDSGEESLKIESPQEPPVRFAFLGARSCDLHAVEIQDRTFLHGPYRDSDYQRRRADLFVIAVNCTQAASTCFCTSMRTGPQVERGFDLALTELPDFFLVEVAGARGSGLLDGLECREASGAELGAAARAVGDAESQIQRRLDTRGLPDLLYRNLEHPRWDEVAQRCLSCTNCTMVCPTCFCHMVEDVPELDGRKAQRRRLWDSCFNPAHSYVAGGLRRPDIRSRYRQWLTHKLASWVDQYGVSGCVGCGRCITWCPVGIDLTEEVAAIRSGESAAPAASLPGRNVLKADPASALPASLQGGSRPEIGPPFSDPERPWQPEDAVIEKITREIPETSTYRLRLPGRPEALGFGPGQFNMVSVPGVGEVPISISGSSSGGRAMDHTIRFVGTVTHVLEQLQPGDRLGLRGPYGRGWPLEACSGQDVILVSGGLGLAPFRPVVRALLARRGEYGRVVLLHGARRPVDLLYRSEYAGWEEQGLEVQTTVDHADEHWQGAVGVVPTLLAKLDFDPARTLLFTCGPEIMMRFTMIEALGRGLPAGRIFLSIELNMQCAVGLCGRCQLGPYFVCKDGPVFSYDRVAPFLNVEHF